MSTPSKMENNSDASAGNVNEAESPADRKRRINRERRLRWVAKHTAEDPDFTEKQKEYRRVYMRAWERKRYNENKELRAALEMIQGQLKALVGK